MDAELHLEMDFNNKRDLLQLVIDRRQIIDSPPELTNEIETISRMMCWTLHTKRLKSLRSGKADIPDPSLTLLRSTISNPSFSFTKLIFFTLTSLFRVQTLLFNATERLQRNYFT